MNAPHDLLLDLPLKLTWMRTLLVFTFALHLLFVLLTIGTALLGGTLLVAGGFGRRRSYQRWGRDVFHAFFAHKGLAIVLGVAPILIFQVSQPVPFMMGINLFAPLWLWIVVLLVAALLLLEAVNEGWVQRRFPVLLFVTAGIACLLAVPGIFAAILVATENPSQWNEMLQRGGRFTPLLATHWFLRLSHVIVAAVILTTAWHYLRTANVRKRKKLGGWLIAALMIQFVLGIALYTSLPHQPQLLIIFVILFGVGIASLWIWRLYRSRNGKDGLPFMQMTTLALGVFVVMILSRQLLQDQVLVPVGEQLAANREQYQEAMTAASGGSPRVRIIEQHPVPQSNPTAIYMNSCGFCHGVVGNGQGDAAPRLLVPPEDLTQLRLSDAAFHRILIDGVNGSAMPRFGFYTRGELDDLTQFLRIQMNMGTSPEPVRQKWSEAAQQEADDVFATTCTACHQETGPPTELAAGFAPPPPDLSEIAFTPQREFEIITNGYPGTLMPSFADLSEETRWALVALVQKIYPHLKEK